MIDWSKLSKSDYELIIMIAHRFEAEFPRPDGYTRLDFIMDMSAAHLDCPMDLCALKAADRFTFAHDIGGITRHLNRQTAKLENCFVPRTAVRSGQRCAD